MAKLAFDPPNTFVDKRFCEGCFAYVNHVTSSRQYVNHKIICSRFLEQKSDDDDDFLFENEREVENLNGNVIAGYPCNTGSEMPQMINILDENINIVFVESSSLEGNLEQNVEYLHDYSAAGVIPPSASTSTVDTPGTNISANFSCHFLMF